MSFLMRVASSITRTMCRTQSWFLTSMNSYSSKAIEPENESSLLMDSKAAQRLEVFENVNMLITKGEVGRLFAVVHLCGKQFKVTDGDVILVEGNWPPTASDRIRLDKVLLAGCKNFTLMGTPLLKPNFVDVQATIIEKTLSHTKTHFRKKRRKQYMRTNFFRPYHTMIRINSINICGMLNKASNETDEVLLK